MDCCTSSGLLVNYLGIYVGVLAVADHLRALRHVPLQVVIVGLKKRVDRSLQDPEKRSLLITVAPNFNQA
jgi:hypothetical protein